MIISHQHKYLFIENPLTASWAIRQELYDSYAGKPILHKHATYSEFYRAATKEEKSYFVFIAVRNPLDVLVSRFIKYQTDHRSAFSSPEAIRENWIDYSDLIKFEYIQNSKPSFEQFFLKFYHRPYSDLVDLSTKDLDFVIRYEHLQEDFAEVLKRLHLPQIRPLPVVNKTGGKRAGWETYYTPATIERAKKVCGPFMKKWGYEFPPAWGNVRVSWTQELGFRIFCAVKNGYIDHFRNNNQPLAQWVRRVRAALIH